MDCITILAQAAEAAGSEAAADSVVPVKLFWEHIVSLGQLEAFMFVSFGAVWLFYGWRVFKILVVISFALLGLALGMTVSQRVQGLNNPLVGGFVGMALLAVLSVPLMRWAVGVLGAIAGAILAAAVWYALPLDQKYIWAGALVGLVAGGMISFIVFKIAVILFSSIGGGALIVAGTLALIYHYMPTKVQMQNLVLYQQWFLPVAIMVPMLVGIIVQNKFIKGSKEWDI